MVKTNSFLPGTFFLFPTAGIPGGITPCLELCLNPCGNGSVLRCGVSGVSSELSHRLSRSAEKNIKEIKFQQWVSPRCFKPWPFRGDPWPIYPGKVTSNVDKKDHDLNHLDNGVIFPICCTKTNGVAARFFGKTFLNCSGCQCWNMWSQEM